jgi:nitroreductase
MVTAPPVLTAQLARRSSSNLSDVAPTDEQLTLILEAATTVPDHGSLHPWRFVVVRGEARATFGDALAQAGAETLGAGDDRLAKLRGKAFVAPALIVLVASPKDSPKVPEWEQICSASCTGYAMALAADALGLGAVWKTAPFLTGTALTAVLGLTGDERVLGWVNVGERSRDNEPTPPRATLAEVATELAPDATRAPFGS